ncbi:hypothetical protein AAE510_005218 [Raoultella ornithinolytica]
MESKTTEFFADLERETDEMITALNYLLAASEEDNKAFLAYLEDEPLSSQPCHRFLEITRLQIA